GNAHGLERVSQAVRGSAGSRELPRSRRRCGSHPNGSSSSLLKVYMSAIAYSLAELCICAAADAWHADGEVLASGITLVPRLAAGLARLTTNSSLLMTDAECHLVSEPVPVGPRGNFESIVEGWMPYSRTFDLLWGGRRHA